MKARTLGNRLQNLCLGKWGADVSSAPERTRRPHSLRPRERDRERRAFADAALHLDMAAVHLDEALDQREAEAGSARVRAACVDLLEVVEDPVLIFAADADPVVAHFDAPVAVVLRADDRDLLPLRAVLV